MEFDELVQRVNQAVIAAKGRPLKSVERIVLKGAWDNHTYAFIAKTNVGYTEDYLKKDVGPNLWKLLTEVIGANTIKVTKRNLQNVLQDWVRQQENGPAATPPAAPPSPDPMMAFWPLPPLDGSGFCGRQEELAELVAWIRQDRCRLVVVWGPTGNGKTLLTAVLAQQIQSGFDRTGYLSLSANTTVASLAHTLAAWLEIGPPETLAALIPAFTQQQCLLILDDGEHLFSPGQLAGTYRSEFAAVRDFIQQVGQLQHDSCLIWLSREKPQDLAQLEGQRVRSHYVEGLSAEDVHLFLSLRGEFLATIEDWVTLRRRTGGSPQLLKGLASIILEVYGGSLQRYLEAAPPLPEPLQAGINQEIERLRSDERELLDWLSLVQQPMNLTELEQGMLEPPPVDVVQSLLARGFCQVCPSPSPTTMLSVPEQLRERVLAQLLPQMCQELNQSRLDRLNRLPLLWTSAPERVQVRQRQALLIPLANHLQQLCPTETALSAKVQQLHQSLRSQNQTQSQPQSQIQPGYAAGNLIHLCQHLDISLAGVDFTHLPIWRANLQRISIQGASFSQAHFAHTLFAMALGREPVMSFSRGGALLAIGDHDGRLLLWNVHDAKLSRVLVADGPAPIRALAFSPDGELLAVGGDDGSLTLWNLNAGYEPDSLNGHQGSIRALVFSPSGDWLAAGDDSGSLKLWDLASGTLIFSLNQHQEPIQQVQASPLGDRLVSCSDDQLACLWDAHSGELLAQYQGSSAAWVRTVGFAPPMGNQSEEPQVLAYTAGYDDHCLVLWDLQTSRPRWILPAEAELLLALSVSDDGRYLACSLNNGTVGIWDILNRRQCAILNGFSSPVWTLVFSPDSRFLVTGSDYAVKLWEVEGGDCLQNLWSQHYPLQCLAFSADGAQLVTGQEDSQLRLWQLSPTEAFTRRCLSFRGHASGVRAVATSPNGHWLASGDDVGLRLWQWETGVCKQIHSEPAGVTVIAFSPDSRWLVGGGDAAMRAWLLDSQDALPQRFEGHHGPIAALAISPDGQTLVSSSRDRTLRLWELSTGQELRSLDMQTGQAHSLAIRADGQCLLMASNDGSVHWWRFPAMELMGTWQHPQGQWLHGIAFDAQNRLIALTSDTLTLELWSVIENCQLQTLSGHTHGIWQVCISCDRQRLATASQDEEIRIWNLENGLCEQVLHPDRPYEGVSIQHASGLSEPEIFMLKSLGAIVA